MSDILGTPGLEGVTFSGGEPFAQAPSLVPLAEQVRAADLSLLIFTGYSLDELRSTPQRSLLDLADVVVAGRYVDSLRSITGGLLGSSNQVVHNLTSRYSSQEIAGEIPVEVRITPEGQVTFTGFPPDELVLGSVSRVGLSH